MQVRRCNVKKKTEFSKLIFWLIYVPVMSVTAFGCVLSWVTQDTSLFTVLLPLLFAELGAATGFYFWKAKNENIIKLKKENGLEIEEDDIER